ncbi:uncharacterized protein LOC135843493 [Planococcus citri]|uniref:uncharacterized protein LOC135843493 n=1 Tax=Planococcus citri TaxID=170843 RepID=UPI0031F81EBB
MGDYYDESTDELVEEEESENSDEYDDEDDDYFSDHECKKCKTDDSYEFVTLNPVILSKVPKLQDMASVTVAASLWNHINVAKAVRSVNHRCTKTSIQWITLCSDVIALIAGLPVPDRIADQIDQYVRKMANEITAWVSYHYRTVFLKNGLDKFVYGHVCHIVWHSNGAIDCVQTAKSIMASVRLSDVEKFRFLCVYCLYDDMDKRSSLVDLDNALDYLNFNEDPLIYYWYCYFRNELDKIPPSIVPININMLHHDKVDNWPAKEYFFDRLGYEERAREAIWLIDNHGAVYQKAVLLKLDETQRLHVLMERATQVIVNYAHPRINSRFILQTWFEARNLINKDQFLTVFRELLSAGVENALSTEIWATANDDFKQHVVSANGHEIVRNVLTGWWRIDCDFIFVLLQDSNAVIKQSVTKQEFFNGFCKRLIQNRKFQQLDRLLQFCLPDADDLAQFKKNFVFDSEYYFFNAHCQNLLLKSEFQDLHQFLEFCLPHPVRLLHSRAKVKNYLMFSNPNVFKTHCETLLMSSKFQELSRLLDFCFPYDKDLLQFKMNLVNNSKPNVVETHCERLLMNHEFQELDRLLVFCLPDADDLVKFKKNFVYSSESNLFEAHCEKLLENAEFQKLDQLLEFCLIDAEDLLQFKRNMVDNSKRNSNIKTYCERLLTNGEFQKLNQLLEFCLPDADHLAQCKRNFVYSSESNLFEAHCEKLLVNGDFKEFDQLVKFCLPDVEDFLQFKTNLINNLKRNVINTHCERLLSNGKFQHLDQLLEFCLPDAENFARSKINIVKNSEHVRKTCLEFYSSGDPNGVDNYLEQLLTLYPDAVIQYKKDLITSSHGIDMCVGIMDTEFSILDAVLEHVLKDPISITEFKRTMILSSAAFSKLTDLLLSNRLNAVQMCIDRFLISTDDRSALKKQLIGDITKLMQAVLRNNDESYLLTVLIWWFGNENDVQEFKRTLDLESIFIAMLKDCVFHEYHYYLTYCKFKFGSSNSSDFNALDRFLNWYFQSPGKVKEYKMKVIHSYSKIDMFKTFLRGNRGDMALRTVLEWFFKNDIAEIAKFKKHGGKITTLI